MYRGQRWPVTADGTADAPVRVPDGASDAPVLDPGAVRWSVAYGSNASVDRLVDKELDESGALLLPARALGWRTAWEGRRVRLGYLPLTLVPATRRLADTWVLGIHRDDTDRLDASEARGHGHLLGHVGPVAVAGRWLLADALAYGPGPSTTVLAVDGRPVGDDALDQQAAAGSSARSCDRGARTRPGSSTASRTGSRASRTCSVGLPRRSRTTAGPRCTSGTRSRARRRAPRSATVAGAHPRGDRPGSSVRDGRPHPVHEVGHGGRDAAPDPARGLASIG